MYTVYFEIYGKKLKADINAISKGDAIKQIKDKIIFHKIEPKLKAPPEFDIPDSFKDIFNELG